MSLVSIIIPVFNCEKYLDKAIQSAVNQTWAEKEVIVVDDGSTDNSLQIAKKFEKEGIIVISQLKKGASAARNTGLKIAKGKWIQFLDADDFIHQDKIAIQLNQLTNEFEVGICKTVHFFEDDLSNAIPDDEVFYQQYLDEPLKFILKLYGGFDYWGAMIQPNAFLVSRTIIEKAGPWNEELSLDDDGEFFCRVLLLSKKIVYCSKGLNFYRKYRQKSSLSGIQSENGFRSQFKSICLKHNHLLVANDSNDLLPFIHTATYKALETVMYNSYPKYITLYKQIKQFAKGSLNTKIKGPVVFGGTISNFIGNKISWKLIRHFKNIRSTFSKKLKH
jgi:glycosyltransferase involved in cell wall biosynthesis